MEEVFNTDVLVIGAGGAGMRAAIAVADRDSDVVLVGKTLTGKAHTVMAEGGVNAALGNVDFKDSWRMHFKDTMQEGQFINNWRMVEILTRKASETIMELERYGALFDRTEDGKIMQRAFGGQSFRRTCHIADRTGLEIMQVLSSEVRRRKKIVNLEECIISKVVKEGKKVIGALGVSLRDGELIVVNCKCVVLATGGLARIYKRSTNAWETVGDGYMLGLDAGAELQDMEMVQFHPTGMVYPENVEGVLVTESVRGEGGILTNSKGERFMKKYDPEKMELSTRDVVARANFHEIRSGRGTKNGGVWLDISHKPAKFIEKKLPKMISKFKDFANVDIRKEKMEVAPTAHYAMGGLKVDPESGRSCIDGLFAAGEISAGVHGANRLGGNSLIDILVFGKLVGNAAVDYCNTVELKEIGERAKKEEMKKLEFPFKRKRGVKPNVIKDRLQELMWHHVGIIRDGQGLKVALKELDKIKEDMKKISVPGDRIYNQGFVQYLDLLAMVPTSEAIVKSALYRKESRGAHFRNDYPKKSIKGLKNVVISMKKGSFSLSAIDVPKMPEELGRVFK